LTNLITPHHAANWRVIGSSLDLSKSDLDIIAHDHGRSAIESCTQMWGKWLETNYRATWEDVLNALKTITQAEKGNSTESHIAKCTYVYYYDLCKCVYTYIYAFRLLCTCIHIMCTES